MYVPLGLLAPQIYVRVKEGDLDGSGALLSGSSVNMQLAGDLTNASGTIAGRNAVVISADNIHNLGGRITGQNVGVIARTDLNVIGGTIDAANSLNAIAGRDINIVTTTRDSRSSTGMLPYSDAASGTDLAAVTPSPHADVLPRREPRRANQCVSTNDLRQLLRPIARPRIQSRKRGDSSDAARNGGRAHQNSPLEKKREPKQILQQKLPRQYLTRRYSHISHPPLRESAHGHSMNLVRAILACVLAGAAFQRDVRRAPAVHAAK